MTILAKILSSTRIQAVIAAMVLAFIQKNFPEFSPDKETVNFIIASIIALIAGDTIRPVDPDKIR